MAQTTKIEWCDVSWNPVHGCSKVSTGCRECYAETLSLRRGFTKAPWTERNAEQNVTLKPHKLREPLSRAKPWDKPCRVFVNSMSDLFHEQIPFEYVEQVFETMASASHHTFQVLTKRPERMREYMLVGPGRLPRPPLPNVWLGVSIENRKWVGRADVLRETPAAVRFISAEPLLGPLMFDSERGSDVGGEHIYSGPHDGRWRDDFDGPELDLIGIDWLILGGESGSGHRPLDVQWMRDLRDMARATAMGNERPDCALFVKQFGGARPGTALEDLPEDLRIREFPR